MVKKIVIALAAIVLLVVIGLVTLVLFLPSEIKAENQIEINASPQKIWEVLEDREKYVEWTPNLERIEVIDQNKWKEFVKGSDIPIVFEAFDKEKPNKYGLKYEMKNLMKGEWVGTLEKSENGTILKTKDTIYPQSWSSKIFMPFFFDLDTFSKEFISKLKKRAESLS